ncbi:MAG: ABC transporter permease subunit, partial [Actinomycetota bacterium]|nr:ABC transporter permease subunit [Actinomycetota bacterium]
MDVLSSAIDWFLDPLNWSGDFGIPKRLLEHVGISLLASAIAFSVAFPTGLYIGHSRRFEFLAVSVANMGRALPSFGVLALVFPFTFQLGSGLGGFAFLPTLISLILLGIPPILTNTYVGIKGVDPDSVEAARGMGLREIEILRSLEAPVSAPLIVAGLRNSAV